MQVSGASHVIVGGGIHGLSVAAALARRLGRSGAAADVVLIERDRLGSGASGIAGGIVRGYYRSPAIAELVRLSVERFEGAADAFGFRQVGFLAIVPERQAEDLEAIAARQAEVGYRSELVTRASACEEYLQWLWPDFDASGVAAVLHERRSGWADASATVRELARAARDAGVTIIEQTEVTGIDHDGRTVAALTTPDGPLRCDHVTFACGVWARDVWRMLGRDFTVTVDGANVSLVDLVKAQEGDFVLPRVGLQAAAGREAPVVHFDADEPLYSARDGRLLTDRAWGIYFRMGRTGTGVTVGGLPVRLGPDAPLDPYGPENADHVAGDAFCEFAEAGLARVLTRFRRVSAHWQAKPHGGVVGLTPDGYPVLDHLLENAYVILDAGHTYKLLALGDLAATDILAGPEPRLAPFRLERFAAGALQPTSKGPYPWT
ncbi:MAG TPA: FAD-binding oxidoreductase [Solirubrobacteraceae bacterium]|nr:FAD-binding oxidoreductase [Solirubrobacteraceae bacterium]